MRRMRVYVSGPLRRGDRRENLRRIVEAGDRLRDAGYAPFIPVLNSGENIETLSVQNNTTLGEAWLAVDLAWVAAADALVRLPGESVGAEEEERCARTLGIPVYSGVEDFLAAPPVMGDRRFHAFLQALGRLHDLKQGDYGRSGDPFANVRGAEEWGLRSWVGAMLRATDKIRRLQTYARRGTLSNEGAEDSMDDLAVYALIAKVLHREEKEIETPQGEYA